MSTPSWVTAVADAGLNVIKIPIPTAAVIELVDAEQLRLCAPSLSKEKSVIMAGLINELCAKYNIKTKDVLHEFLANVLQESLEFSYKVENMYYRALTITKTWPKRFYLSAPMIGKLDANLYAKKPKELANAVYGAANNVLGNRPGTDDGWNLRGSGFIGLTGYYVINQFRKFKAIPTVEEAASYCRDSDYGALDSAFWFFCVLKDLMDEADRDLFIGIVKEINGGTIGMNDRLHYYALVQKHVV